MTSVEPRIVFGVGAVRRVGEELGASDLRRALVITTAGRGDTLSLVRASLGRRLAGVCDRAALHVPAERVHEAAADVGRLSPDVLLAVGGGSAVGLAKAVALECGLPVAAVPTTYAGSEMTSIWGMTDGGVKRTGRDAAVRPRLVVYDPALTLSVPADVSAASGMNAIAHAVEALYAENAGPEAVGSAEEAIRLLSSALPRVVARPEDIQARTMALRGAHLAGRALDLAAMGLHHKICHVLGGSFGLPHALTHAVVLPHVVAFNAPAAPAAMARIADAMGAANAVAGLHALNRAIGLTRSLADLGLHDADLNGAAEQIVAASYANPRAATVAEVRAILTAAFGR